MKKRYLLFAFIPTVIWGLGYVVQTVGVKAIGPNTLNATRFLLAFVFMYPFVKIRRKKIYADNDVERVVRKSALIRGSIICGVFLFIANFFQMWGFKYTSPGKASFITSLYIIIIPFIGLYFGQKLSKRVLVCVVIAMFGMYLLCLTDGISNVNKGDVLELIGAFGFSFQIITISYYSPKCDSLSLATFHILIAGILSTFAMFIMEDPNWIAIKAAWFPIVYSALLISAIGYTFQIISQKHLSPTLASLIFSMESVFALFFAWLLLNDKLSPKEILGCALLFIAIIISQIPEKEAINTAP
ncbi:MAG: DMT family transporter [Sphaerochaetaceae bacterium]|nr:DMT family transporter [Sphaerochaetaceae bacterium]